MHELESPTAPMSHHCCCTLTLSKCPSWHDRYMSHLSLHHDEHVAFFLQSMVKGCSPSHGVSFASRRLQSPVGSGGQTSCPAQDHVLLLFDRSRHPWVGHSDPDLTANQPRASWVCNARRCLSLGAAHHLPAFTQSRPHVQASMRCDASQVVFDPLDGSSILSANLAVGTIFGIWDTPSLLGQSCRHQVAAGYAVYGPRTLLVWAVPRSEGETSHVRVPFSAPLRVVAATDLRREKGTKSCCEVCHLSACVGQTASPASFFQGLTDEGRRGIRLWPAQASE